MWQLSIDFFYWFQAWLLLLNLFAVTSMVGSFFPGSISLPPFATLLLSYPRYFLPIVSISRKVSPPSFAFWPF